MSDEEITGAESPQPAQGNNPFSCLATIGAVCILAAALFFAARESLLTLARSVTPAGQSIVQAQAKQEQEKARTLEIENERKSSKLAEERARAAEWTRQWVRVIEIGLPALAAIAALLVAALTLIVIVQARQAAPEIRAAAVHAAQLRAARVDLSETTGAFPLLIMRDGHVFNPNLQLEPGADIDPRLIQGHYYAQAVRLASKAAVGIASRVSNPNSQAADALPGIVGQVQRIEARDEDKV